MADDWRSPEATALFEAILRLDTAEEAERFFRDLCTLNELRDMAQRWAVVRLLDQGSTTVDDSSQLPAPHAHTHPRSSTASLLVARSRGGGTQRAFERLKAEPPDQVALLHRRRTMRDRLRLGRPQQGTAGRTDAPAPARCRTLAFDEHDRSLVARVQNYDLDVLFVRTNDVIEFVGDGVADLGITGIDLLTETSAELPRIRDLGYGRCRLAAAVPNDSPYQAIEDLAGLRVATAHPNTARRFFELRSIPVDVIPISGAPEVAPRLGLAEAIVDLVSTGSTMVMNGLRPIGDVLSSEAVLVANPAAHRERATELTAIDTMLTAVIAARGQKYLLMNAPAAKLAELEGLLPGLESPSVIPLALTRG